MSAGEPAQAQAGQAEIALQVSKRGLDHLAIARRPAISLGAHKPLRIVAGVLVDIARDLARRRVGAALMFERARIAIGLAGAIKARVAGVDPAGENSSR